MLALKPWATTRGPLGVYRSPRVSPGNVSAPGCDPSSSPLRAPPGLRRRVVLTLLRSEGAASGSYKRLPP